MSAGSGQQLPQFITMNLLSGLSMGLAGVTLPLFAASLGGSAVLLGLLAVAQSVGILMMGLPAGLLVDRHGPGALLLIGSLTVGVLYMSLALTSSLAMVAGVVLLAGCLMPLRSVALSALFMQKIVAVGVARSGWFRASYMGGQILLAPLLAALLIGHLGYSGTYLIIGVSFMAVLLMYKPVIRHYQPSAAAVPRLSLAALKQQLQLLIDDPRLRRYCGWELSLQACNQFFTFFIALIAIRRFNVELATATSLITLHGVCYVLALLWVGRLVQAIGEYRVRRTGCALTVIALLCLTLAGSITQLRLAAPLLGAGMGMLQVLSLGGLAQASQRHGPGRVSGINIFLFPLGGLLGSALGGVVGNYIGLQHVFALLALVFATIGLRRR